LHVRRTVRERYSLYGVTTNCRLLVNVPLEVVTVIKPVVAPAGTVAVREVPDCTVADAATPLKETVVVEVKPCPRISTALPTARVN
jgi:hypothetical protein